MKISIPRVSFALLAGAALFAPGAWSAPPLATPQPRMQSVKFSPSEAATPEGAASLYAKVREAALRVCSEPQEMLTGGMEEAARNACVKDAVADAVRSIDIPMVAVMHVYAERQPVMASR